MEEELTVNVSITVFRSNVVRAFTARGWKVPENWEDLMATYIDNMGEFFSNEIEMMLEDGQIVRDLEQMEAVDDQTFIAIDSDKEY